MYIIFWFLLFIALGEIIKLIYYSHFESSSEKGTSLELGKRLIWDVAAGFTIVVLLVQVLWTSLPSIPLFYESFTTGTRYINILAEDQSVITWGVISLISIFGLAATISVLVAPFRKTRPWSRQKT